MVAIDEARLDKLYQSALQIEKDMLLEKERLSALTNESWLRQKKEDEELRALRKSKRHELVQAATAIFDWVRDLAKNPKGARLLSIVEEVTIFRAHYFKYRPSEDKRYEAMLMTNGNGRICYSELINGSFTTKNPEVFDNPEWMVNRLHPDFILSALDAITRGDVWDEIERSAIKWRVGIFDARRQSGEWLPKGDRE